MPNGKLYAIKVQDISTSEWFTYTSGAWDKTPVVIPATGNLYVAAWVTNYGTTGNITLIISIQGDSYYIRKTQNVPANSSFGAEGTWTMPSGNAYVIITVSDG